MLKFNVKTSILPPPPSLTSGKGFCFTILCIVTLLTLFSQSVQADTIYTNTYDVAEGQTTTVSTTLSGTGLYKTGKGILNLQATNKYSGETLIDLGTLKLSNSGTLGSSSSISIEDGAILQVDNVDLQTGTSALISGGGTIRFSGNSSFKATGTHSDFTGKIVVDANKSLLIRGMNGSTELQAIDNFPNATLELNAGSNLVLVRNAWASSLTVKQLLGADTTTVIRANDNSATDSAPSLTVGSGSYAGDIGTNSNDTQKAQSDANKSFIKLIKSSDGSEDGGTLTLSGNHYYTQGTTIEAGTLEIKGNASLGTGTVAVNEGATLLINNRDFLRSAAISGAGTIKFTGSGSASFKTTGEQTNFTGKIVVDANKSLLIRDYNGSEGKAIDNLPNATLELNSGSNLVLVRQNGWASSLNIKALNSTSTDSVIRANSNSDKATIPSLTVGSGLYAGNIGVNGNSENNWMTLIKKSDGSADGGTLTLSGNHYYTGGTTINAGTLKLTGNGTLGSGTVSIGKTATTEGVLEFAHTSAKSFANTFSGSGTIKKTGSEKLTLTAGSSFTGSFIVSDGTLALGYTGEGGTLGSGTTLTVTGENSKVEGSGDVFWYGDVSGAINLLNGGTLHSTGIRIAIDWDVNMTGGHMTAVTGSTDQQLLFGNKITVSKNENYSESTITAPTITFRYSAKDSAGIIEVQDGASLTMSSKIIDWTESSQVPLTKTGDGVLIFSGTNELAKGTVISDGTFKLIGDGTLGTGVVKIADGATLEVNVESGSKKITNQITGVTVNNVTTYGNIRKTGAGILQLNGEANPIETENIALESGRLDIKGYLDSSLVAESGTILSPGNSVGTLIIKAGTIEDPNELIIQTGATLLVEMDSATSMDKIEFANSGDEVDFQSGSILELVAIDGYTPKLNEDISQTLFDNIPGLKEALTKDASGNSKTTFSSYYFNINYDASGNPISIVTNPNAVPEPSTWALLVLGFAGLMWLRRKRERQ